MTQNAFEVSVNEKGTAIVTFDLPNESMNVLRTELLDEINGVIDAIEANSDIRGVVIRSGKSSGFIAGADISMLDAAEDAASATKLPNRGKYCLIGFRQ